MKWIKVNNEDDSTLPPLEKMIWMVYRSMVGIKVITIGARTGYGEGWLWGVNNIGRYGKGDKFLDLDTDDDYRVTHWAEIEWPED